MPHLRISVFICYIVFPPQLYKSLHLITSAKVNKMLPPIQIVFTVIGTISMSLYIFLIAALLHFRVRCREIEYRSSFFAIFISLGVADIIQRVSSEFTVTLTFDPNLQTFYLTVGNANNHLLAKFCVFLQNFLGVVQCAGSLLISLNRYTAISYPIKHATV